MDLRTAKTIKIDEATLALIPTVSGEAKKLTEKSKRLNQPDEAIANLIQKFNDKLNNNLFSLNDCLEAIEQLINLMNKCATPYIYETHLVALLCFALATDDLSRNDRESFCQVFIDGIRGYFSTGGINFEYGLSYVLFKQVENDVSDEVKNQIKQMLIDLILYVGNNGIIEKISHSAKLYLKTNKSLANSLFNTIVKLAEDEMNHQKFNTAYLKEHKQRDDLEFLPNMTNKILDAYIFIDEDCNKKYQSKKPEIIVEYLFNETQLDLSDFDLNNYDIAMMCNVVNCSLTLKDTEFAHVVKKLLLAMINTWKESKKNHNSHEILDVYSICDVRQFFQNELINNETTQIVLNTLFDEVDFSKFVNETLEFYLELFGGLLAEYFDSHSDIARRANCEKILSLLEEKVVVIKEERIKFTLYKSLVLSVTTYGGLGDWSKLPSKYTYSDIQFLNEMFKKYGEFHIKEILHTIYKLHYDKLLPEILISIRDAFKNALIDDVNTKFTKTINECKSIIIIIISKAFFDFSEKIKQDDDLTKAFEDILEILSEINLEEAATILDEFRIH